MDGGRSQSAGPRVSPAPEMTDSRHADASAVLRNQPEHKGTGMNRLTGHAWLLLGAAAGAALCLELIDLQRAPVVAASAVVVAPGPETGNERATRSGAKHMRPPLAEASTIEAEPEQISSRSAKEPPAPKLVAPPVEVKRPPKKPARTVADGDGALRTAKKESGSAPPAFVKSLLTTVGTVFGL